MRLRIVTAALVAAAAAADALGSHELAYYALVAAVPAGAVAALTALGAILDRTAAAPADRALAVLSALVLPFLLLATAVRAPLVLAGPPPPLAVTALLCCLGVFALQGLVLGAALLETPPRPERRPQPQRRAAEAEHEPARAA